MLIYDEAAAAALHAAAGEARRLGKTEYDTAHVLLGLLGTAAPVTRKITQIHPQLTLDAARSTVSSASNDPAVTVAQGVDDATAKPVPAQEFRRAMKRFTAKWRPLVRARQLRFNPKLGTGELWLTVLEPQTTAASVITSLRADPETIRRVVLAGMAPDGIPLPEWPAEPPVGPIRRRFSRCRIC